MSLEHMRLEERSFVRDLASLPPARPPPFALCREDNAQPIGCMLYLVIGVSRTNYRPQVPPIKTTVARTFVTRTQRDRYVCLLIPKKLVASLRRFVMQVPRSYLASCVDEVLDVCFPAPAK